MMSELKIYGDRVCLDLIIEQINEQAFSIGDKKVCCFSARDLEYNAETLAAMQELKDGKGEEISYDDLMAQFDKDDEKSDE